MPPLAARLADVAVYGHVDPALPAHEETPARVTRLAPVRGHGEGDRPAPGRSTLTDAPEVRPCPTDDSPSRRLPRTRP